MYGAVTDTTVQRDAVAYLTRRPQSRCSELAAFMELSYPTCRRLLDLLRTQGRVVEEMLDLDGNGRLATLWSGVSLHKAPPPAAPTFRMCMTPDEMAADIQSRMAQQPLLNQLLTLPAQFR